MTEARSENAILDQPLRGWKEIVAYAGVSKSTLKRWTAIADFPLYRTIDNGMVYAFPQEIDEWWRKDRRVSA